MRLLQPRVGARKLFDDVCERFGKVIGRDRFFEVLREHSLLLKPREKNFTRTTYSNHPYAVAPNLLHKVEPTGANQVYVADITYLSLKTKFVYLFLVTDLYSRKIVGWHLSESLGNEGARLALEMALKNVDDSDNIIHHSDRGCQYCCHKFRNYLKSKGMLSSMTDENHCYQNAVAERVNGILKDEFYLDLVFDSFAQLNKVLEQTIFIYNNYRRHNSLGNRRPAEVHAAA